VQAAETDGRNSGQGSVYSRDAISPRLSPVSSRNSSPRRIHASPEGLLKQRAHPRLARSPARAGFVVKQPWPNRLTNRPCRRRIQCEDRLTPYPDTRASVGKVKVTAVTELSAEPPPEPVSLLLICIRMISRSHFALPLTDLTGKQRSSPLSDCCATRQGEDDNS
jgi:hypothetical protein